jgi:flagellar basal-body rod modification protein FlgD
MLAEAVAGTTPQPISSLVNINQPSTTKTTGSATLGPDAFLQLLTTELRNQDPTQPQDPTQQVSQLAQMSALQYQQQLSTAFQNFQSNFGVLQAASLIGKQATVSVGSSGTGGNSSTVTGTIASVEVQNGQPFFTMTDTNGKVYTDNTGSALLFSTSEILGIGSAPAAGQ